MNKKEYHEDFDLMLQEVEQEIEWYDLQLGREELMSNEEKKKLLKKKYAILSQIKHKL